MRLLPISLPASQITLSRSATVPVNRCVTMPGAGFEPAHPMGAEDVKPHVRRGAPERLTAPYDARRRFPLWHNLRDCPPPPVPAATHPATRDLMPPDGPEAA